MAGEQSTGTFLKLESDDDPVVQRQSALVENVTPIADMAGPSLPGAAVPSGGAVAWRQADVTLSWPLDTIGPSLPNLMATVAGNLFELRQLSGIRLLDVNLPHSFLAAYQGPAFGVAGTRRLAGVDRLPLIGTIIKPSVGLTPEATAGSVKTLIESGIDFIKDDELQSDGPYCPFADRVAAVMRVVNDAAQQHGRKVMYAFNITGEIDDMRRRHDVVLGAGGTCIMVSLNHVGLPGLTHLRRNAALPIHGHRNGWGLFYRAPMIGIDYLAYQKIWRLAGADHLHVNGFRNKFAESDQSCITSARACLTPMSDNVPHVAMPVFSSGQWAGQASDTFRALGSADLIYACGGGIVGHPQGATAGVQSIHDAWDAALDGQDLAARASSSPSLAAALAFFG